jgi:hypothetical protein
MEECAVPPEVLEYVTGFIQQFGIVHFDASLQGVFYLAAIRSSYMTARLYLRS